MNVQIGKEILKKLEASGMSKSEFARRINKSPQNVQDIFTRQSIDTKLLLDISDVLDFNFFTFFLKESEQKLLIGSGSANEKLNRLSSKLDKMSEVNSLLKKTLKDKERIIALLSKNTPSLKKGKSK